MAIDNKKRTMLKAIAAGGSMAVIPGVVTAAFNGPAMPHAALPNSLGNEGLVISFGENPGIDGVRRIIVTNTSNTPINLSQVYPSVVSTPDGQYDLNSLLVDGRRQFAPHEAMTLSIKSMSGAPVNKVPRPTGAAQSMISVRTTHPNTNSGEPVTTMRALFA